MTDEPLIQLHTNAAWLGFLLGMLLGAAMGLRFDKADWLGGYASWARRLIRLGHISFFGLGLMNLAFAATVRLGMAPLSPALEFASALLLAGAVLMPLTCFAAAWRPGLRHLFALPVGVLVTSTAIVVWQGVVS